MVQEEFILTEAQLHALERAKQEKEATGEIETEHPGYLGAQDTAYVGTLKEVRRIYQQTFIDTYCKVAFVKLHDIENALLEAALNNYKVISFYGEHGVPLLRVLTDRGQSIVGVLSIMSMSYIWQWKILTTARPGQNLPS